jgi:hypothetical protein
MCFAKVSVFIRLPESIKKSLCHNGKGFLCTSETGLLQFGFFVDNVLTGNGIEFFNFEFAGHIAFVLGGGVEVTSASRRFQFDFIAHCVFL